MVYTHTLRFPSTALRTTQFDILSPSIAQEAIPNLIVLNIPATAEIFISIREIIG